VLRPCEYLAEHEGFELTCLPVDSAGLVSPEALKQALRKDTILVSIMAANNEIGTVQPIAELGAVCQEHGVKFHTDAVQWLGKEPFANLDQFNADLVSICAHKIHGPKGAGVLFVKSPLFLDPILLGGSHENERRAGTENLAGITGMVAALEHFVREPVFPRRTLMALTGRLAEALDKIDGVKTIGSRERRLPNTVSFVAEGTDNIALLAALDLDGICASGGSACSAGSLQASHVAKAIGIDEALGRSLVRFSLGRESSILEVERAVALLPGIIQRVRSKAW
jgi:cysteine desulfurase